ncbi:MAG: paraslipin [Firmicutes bacterium]|jgi:regulator of protease activity HflC (stomatin/prohibitin superfamily)|nr:paraslipin [Bacillota bacterium]
MIVTDIVAALIILCVVLIARQSILIVHQAETAIVERFGKFHRAYPSGLGTLLPFFDRVRSRVDLREQFINVPPQPVITRDNVTISIDSVLFFQVTDPERAVYSVKNFSGAVENLVQTTLRSIIGEMSLDDTLSNRETINAQLGVKLDRETNEWGVKVHRIEIKQIDPPMEIKQAMEKQMRAERDKRATITQAEAMKQSQILESEGFQSATVTRARAEREKQILEAEGRAEALLTLQKAEAQSLVLLRQAEADPTVLQLKAYQTLAQMSQGQSTTILLPSNMGEMAGMAATFGQAMLKTGQTD